mmetsp:Transcript_13046/g.17037  ORF Transcript_13046/g.17037 Transcript_13046/m.17037 type:complete len:281 (+) Transcript_13046:187-1029(+)|eukprot:CAMPEP_0116070202 /NCGR_PEP_ID=MMETSP0322-20121206/12857_1 /TAXON_ID=163516 /ORGANISM="Leptocylindrus danicus var. apora, Strain B651" /LENGTH=280 /DNA_ID=CAMNT_0003557941 /DNA_START=187 /DNA_END=1029 /DNA_ORIENTATION=-
MVAINTRKTSSIRHLFANFLVIVSVATVSFWIGFNEGKTEGTLKSTAISNEENIATVKKEGEAVGDHPFLWNGETLFNEAARSLSPITDKVTTHTYQIMYGQYLMPYYHLHPNMKMLEIGLGCNMNYGPGASVALWRKIFPQAEVWEAEFDEECVNKKKDDLKGINIMTGDQSNNTDLDRWIVESGGNFDVIIDDGGHHSCQVWTSFQKLWPTVKRGGYYFIEDLQVAKSFRQPTLTCGKDLISTEKIKEIFEQLMFGKRGKTDIKFMFCQSEACVLGKK